MKNICSPPINIIIQIVEAHPATGSPKHNRLITINPSAIKDRNEINIPNHEAIASGSSEKFIIPSKAYFVNFQKFHLESPATLSEFSKGSQ